MAKTKKVAAVLPQNTTSEQTTGLVQLGTTGDVIAAPVLETLTGAAGSDAVTIGATGDAKAAALIEMLSGKSTGLLSDDGLARAIAATPAERVTEEYIRSRIVGTDYMTVPGTTVTICHITLDNGYSVRGESACVNPANFRQDIGERIAHDDAFRKLWPLFGFLLAEANHRRGQGVPAVPVDLIARTAHEVNRAVCEFHGDHSQAPWSEAQPWQRESAVKGIAFALENPDVPASTQHDAWMADKLADGWTHGEVKDADAKTHPCIVPYDQLPPEQRIKDHTFRAVVRGLTA